MKNVWKGTGTALITPFKPGLEPDLEAFANLLEHAIQGGVDYLVILGTTAETATLRPEEKRRIAHVAVEANRGRTPMMLGIGGNDTRSVAREMRQFDLSGYQAVLSVSPYYNRPTQEGIFRHFEYLSAACPLPLILYNVPSRTGTNMEAGTTLRLAAQCPNIAGIKEASGDMDQVRRLLAERPEGFLVISGDDFNAAEVALAGGDGVISVLAQALPGPFSGMTDLALEGREKEAKEAFGAMHPLCDAIFREGNPTGIKSLLSLLGLSGADVRLPLVPASDGLRKELNEALGRFQPLAVKKN